MGAAAHAVTTNAMRSARTICMTLLYTTPRRARARKQAVESVVHLRAVFVLLRNDPMSTLTSLCSRWMAEYIHRGGKEKLEEAAAFYVHFPVSGIVLEKLQVPTETWTPPPCRTSETPASSDFET